MLKKRDLQFRIAFLFQHSSLILVLLLLFNEVLYSQVYTDQASNYNGVWANGSNGGSGFGPWVTNSQNNTGRFIGNPANDGMATIGIGTTAFGMWATSSTNYSNAYRPFSVALEVGDVFSFYWVMNWDSNTGSKGFDLRSGSTAVFTVSNAGNAQINSSNGRASDSYGVIPMEVRLLRLSATQYLFSMSRRNSGGGLYTTVINTTLAIDGIAFFIGAQSGSDGQRNMYYNQFSIEKGVYTEPLPNFVLYKWSGGLTPTSIKVNAKVASSTVNARLVVSTSNTFSNPIYSSPISIDAATNHLGSFHVTTLSPNTAYFYGVESNGVLDTRPEAVGRFRTPQAGAHSFSFTAGACNTNSTGPVFQRILEKNPLFMLAHGDLHYADPNSTNVNVHRLPYEERVLSIDNTKNLFSAVPIAYVWDDHDFSGDDSNANSIGANSAKQAYREYVPHYPFGTGIVNGNSSIYQSFVIGRVRFILTDLRSEMTTSGILSATQLQWFKDECLSAKASDQIICWVSSYGITSNTSDSWGGTVANRSQRNEVFQFLNENQITNLFIVSGDAHASGIDDGANTDCNGELTDHTCPRFECSLNPRYPLLHAAGLYNTVSIKGIVTNVVPMTGINFHGQYAKIDVTDTGSNEISITFTLYRVHPDTGVESTLGSYSFTRSFTTTEATTTLVPSGSTWRYLDNGSDQGTAWVQPVFNDSSWLQSTAPLGYGMNGVSTVVSFGSNPNAKYITTYFRKKFTVSDLSSLTQLWSELWLDDGAVVYLNGTEIGRANFSHPTHTYLSPATTVVTNVPSYFKFCVDDLSLLQLGENTLAVEVHQHSGSSSDLYFDFRMVGAFDVTLSSPDLTESASFDGISVFPNPTRDYLQVVFKAPASYQLLRLFDVHGKQLFETVISSGNEPISVDLRTYEKGVYFLEFSNSKHKKVKRILKD